MGIALNWSILAIAMSLLLFIPMNVANQHFYGIAYSPYRQYLACPKEHEIKQDYELAKAHTTRIRMYSTECHLLNDFVLEAANQHSAEVLMGLWIDNNPYRNTQEMNDLYTYLRKYPHAKILGIAVGNEVLYRQTMSPYDLAQHVGMVKAQVRQIGYELGSSVLQNVPVFSVDVIPHPVVVGASDAIGVNIHPYYQSNLEFNSDPNIMSDIALAAAVKQITTFQQLFYGKEVFVTETGWPSQSAPHERNRGDLQVAKLYRQKFASWADGIGLKYFIFELVDSPWKKAQYPHEPSSMHEFHWGLYTFYRLYK